MKQDDTMNPIANPVVELKDVHKSFGSNQVLKGVSFAIPKGQVVAIIGKSGSGKSTALRCIDRLEIIDSGTIHVCGHAVHDPAIDLRQLRQDVGVASRTIIWSLVKQMRVRLIPLFHGLHGRTALER